MTTTTDYFRHCPLCDRKLYYKTQVCRDNALKNNNQCKSCAMRKMHAENPDRVSGANNPMFGRSAADIWNASLSPDVVQAKKHERSRRMSEAQTGEKNAMFGKPSPTKAGRGISGTWKGQHFRSLLELAFLEFFWQKHGILPTSAESHRHKIALANGRNYFPDFVHNGIIYEVKPKRLLNTPANLEKFEAAKSVLGDLFKIITDADLNYSDIHLRLDSFDDLHINEPHRVPFWTAGN